jgi:hypothetical protein
MEDTSPGEMRTGDIPGASSSEVGLLRRFLYTGIKE